MSGMSVSELMRPCGDAVIHCDTSLRRAAELILTTGLEALPVADIHGSFSGLVSQPSLVRRLLQCGSGSGSVEPIVSRHIESARESADVGTVLPLFRSASVSLIPVVDAVDQPVGFVHRCDVIRHLLSDGREDRKNGSFRKDMRSKPHFLNGRRAPAADETPQD